MASEKCAMGCTSKLLYYVVATLLVPVALGAQTARPITSLPKAPDDPTRNSPSAPAPITTLPPAPGAPVSVAPAPTPATASQPVAAGTTTPTTAPTDYGTAANPVHATPLPTSTAVAPAQPPTVEAPALKASTATTLSPEAKAPRKVHAFSTAAIGVTVGIGGIGAQLAVPLSQGFNARVGGAVLFLQREPYRRWAEHFGRSQVPLGDLQSGLVSVSRRVSHQPGGDAL